SVVVCFKGRFCFVEKVGICLCSDRNGCLKPDLFLCLLLEITVPGYSDKIYLKQDMKPENKSHFG
ncbi:MAG: hypothetical protein ABIN24_09705, partial [Dyadobacter sp.]